MSVLVTILSRIRINLPQLKSLIMTLAETKFGQYNYKMQACGSIKWACFDKTDREVESYG